MFGKDIIDILREFDVDGTLKEWYKEISNRTLERLARRLGRTADKLLGKET